jgi:hypothetical protein
VYGGRGWFADLKGEHELIEKELTYQAEDFKPEISARGWSFRPRLRRQVQGLLTMSWTGGVPTCMTHSPWAELTGHRSPQGRTPEATNPGVIKVETTEELAYTSRITLIVGVFIPSWQPTICNPRYPRCLYKLRGLVRRDTMTSLRV